MYKFFFIIHACTRKRKRKRSLGCARDDDTERAAPFLFFSLREPASAPSGHLLPGEGGSMPTSRIVISSESEKSFSFAVKNRGEERDHGKHRTPCSAGCRYVKGLSRIPFHPAAGANLRPFGAPPSGGRREYAAFPHTLFSHLNTRTGWRPVRAVFLESSEWSSHKTIGL